MLNKQLNIRQLKLLMGIGFACLMTPFHLYAGWLITGRYIDQEGITVMKRYFIGQDWVKVETYKLIYSCNLKTGELYLVDPQNLVYTKTTLNEYSSKILEINNKRAESVINLVPEELKSKVGGELKDQSVIKIQIPFCDTNMLSFTLLHDSSKLLGYKCLKYSLTESGKRLEEFLFTPEVDISKDINILSLLHLQYLLEPEDKTFSYVASVPYQKLTRNGLVLRRFIYQNGYRTEWQVNGIEKKEIPAYEFGAPSLCKLVNLDKWLSQFLKDDGKYDDYE